MRSYAFAFLFTVSFVAAQKITVTSPNGPTVVEVFTMDAKGFSLKTTIATLTGSSTSRTSSPVPTTPPTPSLTSTPNPKITTATGQSPSRPNVISVGAIVGIVIGAVALLALALALFLYRRRRRTKRRFSRVELDPLGSPIADKQFAPDPFITDSQAIRLGYDRTSLPTRRIEAKFVGLDSVLTPPVVPRIFITRDGESEARPISLSSSGHHGQSPTTTTPPPRPRFYGDTKFVPPPRTSSAASSSATLNEPAPSSTQAELTRRMRDLLAQLEHHAVSPNDDSRSAVTQLQRQVEVLQRENDELRHTGGEAPPAYNYDYDNPRR